MTGARLLSVGEVASRYCLPRSETLPSPRSGEILARGTGGSIEFEEFRAYVPGDDPRHIDWSAYARSDQILVRLHRPEVRLAVEVVLDASRSMATGDGAKEARSREIALLFCLLGRRAGAAVRFWVAGDGLERIGGDPTAAVEAVAFEGRTPLPLSLAGAADLFDPGSVRIVISDFLFPHDPNDLHFRLARTAARVGIVQLLDPEEAEPVPGGFVRLVDVETGEERSLALDGRAVTGYRARLASLVAGLEEAARRSHDPFASCRADRDLDSICREVFLPARLVEPAPGGSVG
jgi:uncharacterized protein (DUF58 family)